MNIEDVHSEILLLRKRLHEVSNFVASQEGKILNLDGNTQNLKDTLQEAEKSIRKLEEQIANLNTQSVVLKWMAGLFSSVFLVIIVEQIKIIMNS